MKRNKKSKTKWMSLENASAPIATDNRKIMGNK